VIEISSLTEILVAPCQLKERVYRKKIDKNLVQFEIQVGYFFEENKGQSVTLTQVQSVQIKVWLIIMKLFP